MNGKLSTLLNGTYGGKAFSTYCVELVEEGVEGEVLVREKVTMGEVQQWVLVPPELKGRRWVLRQRLPQCRGQPLSPCFTISCSHPGNSHSEQDSCKYLFTFVSTTF